MSASYNLSAQSAGSQTRIKDCFASRYGVTSGDVDDAFISGKLDEFVQSTVDGVEERSNVFTPTPL